MARRHITPTDQTGHAAAPGLPHTDTVQADPLTGTYQNVSVTVTYALNGIDGGASIAYSTGGGPSGTIDSVVDDATGGNVTTTVNLGTIDMTNFQIDLQASGPFAPGAFADLVSWSIAFDGAGLIVDTGAEV